MRRILSRLGAVATACVLLVLMFAVPVPVQALGLNPTEDEYNQWVAHFIEEYGNGDKEPGETWLAYVARGTWRTVNAIPDYLSYSPARKYYTGGDKVNLTPQIGNSDAVSMMVNYKGDTNYTNFINNTTNNNYTYYDITNNQYYDITNITHNNTYNVYNVEVNNTYNYVTNYYITYAPTYVNITYLDTGQNRVYSNNYYYQLPDGRNSYNLKAADVWGEYFIYDVVNYDLVVEDDNTLALFHLDGSFSDDSAFSKEFKWKTGATQSFVEHSGYGSALYMPPGDRDFFFSSSSSGTIEFMLYLTQPSSLPSSTVAGGGSHTERWTDEPWTLQQGPRPKYTSFLPAGYSIDKKTNFNSEYVGWITDFSHESKSGNATIWHYSGQGSATFYSPPIGYVFSLAGTSYLPIRLTGIISYVGTKTSDLSTWTSESKWTTSISNVSLIIGEFDNPLTIGTWQYIAVSGGKLFVNGSRVDYAVGSSPDAHFHLIQPAMWGNYWLVDEIRASQSVLYSGSSYTPQLHPFDTNEVLVLPEGEQREGAVAIKSSVPVTSARFGGVRPTYPVVGDVYVALEDGEEGKGNRIVQSVQQYHDGGWVAVGGTIYHDGEWVQLKGFDMTTYTLDEFEPPGGDGGDGPGDGGGGENPGPGGDGGGGGGSGNEDNTPWDELVELFTDLWERLRSWMGGGSFPAPDPGGDGGGGSGGGGTEKPGFWNKMGDMGGFPGFLASSLGFIPAEIMALIVFGLVVAIVLMIVNYIRGR